MKGIIYTMVFYAGTLLIIPAICGYSSLGLKILPTCMINKECKNAGKNEQQKSPCMPCCSIQCHCDIVVIHEIPDNEGRFFERPKMIITDVVFESLFAKPNWQPPEMS